MVVILTRKRQMPIEVEAVEGTAETLIAADVQFGVEELESSFTPELQERNPLRATLSREGVVVGAKFGEITGRTEIVQRIAADPVTTVPPFHDVLLASGHAQAEVKTSVTTAGAGTFRVGEHVTGASGADVYVISSTGTLFTYVLPTGNTEIVGTELLTGDDSGATVTSDAGPTLAVTGVAYHPVSSGTSAFTLGDYMDGVETTLFGSRATGTFGAGGVGQIGYLNFTFNGQAAAPGDQPLLTGTSVPNIVPETFLSAAVTAGSGADLLCVDAFSLDFGNTLGRRNCANQANGIISYRITERLPLITIDPERDLEANVPFFTNFDAATQFGFNALIGQTAGTRARVIAGRCQYSELAGADREGIATLNATLRPAATTSDGDDEYFICFH